MSEEGVLARCNLNTKMLLILIWQLEAVTNLEELDERQRESEKKEKRKMEEKKEEKKTGKEKKNYIR